MLPTENTLIRGRETMIMLMLMKREQNKPFVTTKMHKKVRQRKTKCSLKTGFQLLSRKLQMALIMFVLAVHGSGERKIGFNGMCAGKKICQLLVHVISFPKRYSIKIFIYGFDFLIFPYKICTKHARCRFRTLLIILHQNRKSRFD